MENIHNEDVGICNATLQFVIDTPSLLSHTTTNMLNPDHVCGSVQYHDFSVFAVGS